MNQQPKSTNYQPAGSDWWRPAPMPEEEPLGIYVHVPFCSSTCDFCAFYQQAPGVGDFDRFVDGIARELDLVDTPAIPSTVFWGGGTPGLLTPRHIRRLGELLRAKFPSIEKGGIEWTVELTPGCVKIERLEALREIGATRISVGAQSFQPRLLKALGRRHQREKIFSAWEMLRGAGFKNLNIDLMFALPGQNIDEWRADMVEAAALRPEHISTYCLTFEDDTAIYARLSNGLVAIDLEKEAAFYMEAWEEIERLGYRQYEISNFAIPGCECIHNMNTWRMGSWVGLGPSAASQAGGRRSSNPADLGEWLAALLKGERSACDRVSLTPLLLAVDSLIFGLRMNAGVNLEEIELRFGVDIASRIEPSTRIWEDEGLMQRAGGHLRLTTGGRLLADRIASSILDILD